MQGEPPSRADEARHCRQCLRFNQPARLLIPDQPAPHARHRPESGKEPRPIRVDRERMAVVPLEPPELPGDERPAFRIERDAVAVWRGPPASEPGTAWRLLWAREGGVDNGALTGGRGR